MDRRGLLGRGILSLPHYCCWYLCTVVAMPDKRLPRPPPGFAITVATMSHAFLHLRRLIAYARGGPSTRAKLSPRARTSQCSRACGPCAQEVGPASQITERAHSHAERAHRTPRANLSRLPICFSQGECRRMTANGSGARTRRKLTRQFGNSLRRVPDAEFRNPLLPNARDEVTKVYLKETRTR